ncbi:MAG TPA: glycosyltransferase family 87 protein [Anaeromyxobacteraceae bacterium]
MTQRFRDKVTSVLLAPRVYLGAMFFIALAAGLHQFLYIPRPDGYTRYNNYLIFKQSFVHLVRFQDLYAFYPAEHFDNFLYSPTFAALMAPFAHLPDGVGLLAWDLLNAGILALALWRLPGLDSRTKGLVAWFVAPEFLGSIQNSQSNAMVAGLVILAFVYLERQNAPAASLMVAFAFYIKLFPLVAGAIFLVYRQRWRLAAWTAAWLVVLGLVPLLLVSFHQLELLYGSWLRLHTTSVHAASGGLSVQGWLRSWFGLEPPRLAVLAVGGALMLAPLSNIRARAHFDFRLLFLASVLMWMIVFNHLAESPTFVVAMCGVALWVFSQPRTPLRSALAAAAFFFVSFAYSDLFPRGLREQFVKPYVLKAVPVILAWLVLTAELVFARRGAPPGADRAAHVPHAPERAVLPEA